MELYIKVSFWLGIAAIVIRGLLLIGQEYPREVTTTVGEEVVLLLVSIAFTAWAARLLWP